EFFRFFRRYLTALVTIRTDKRLRSTLVETFPDLFSGIEIVNSFRRNLYRFPCARITANTRFALAGGESTKTAQLYTAAFSQFLGDLVKEQIDNFLYFIWL